VPEIVFTTYAVLPLMAIAAGELSLKVTFMRARVRRDGPAAPHSCLIVQSTLAPGRGWARAFR
jgi:hypothetical protein